jgi:hypothetical protein
LGIWRTAFGKDTVQRAKGRERKEVEKGTELKA